MLYPTLRQWPQFLALALLSGTASAAPTIQDGFTVVGIFSRFDGVEDTFAPEHNVTALTVTPSATSGSFAAFCAEPTVAYSPSATYDAPTAWNAASLANGGRIVSLFEQFYAQASSPTPSSSTSNAMRFAFQVALWELVADDGNVNTGSYRLASETDPDYEYNYDNLRAAAGYDSNVYDRYYVAPTLVTQLLDASNVVIGSPSYALMHVNSATSQDMVYATAVASAVPEPGTMGLAAAGVAVAGLAARRRRPQATQA